MTEYTSSPEAVREYMSAKERTAWWIRHHPPTEQYSPSAPPSERSELEEDAQSYTVIDSDAESTRSIPPKMLLKYGDGRPDIPISHWHHDHSGEPLSRSVSTRDNGYPSHRRSNDHRRSRSEQPVARTTSRQLHPQDNASMRFPEEIRVLPSESHEAPRPAASQYQRRSKSQPSHGYSPPEEPKPPLPLYLAPQHTPQPIHTSGPRSIYQNPVQHRAPQVAYSQSHPMYQKKDPYASRYPDRDRSPPSIVYAPRTNSRNYYAPPTLIHHQHGAPGPRYPTGGPPFSLARGGLASVNEDTKSRGPSTARATRGHGSRLDESRSQTPSSQGTGSTYYVLPSPGQKVQIVSPDRSMYASSTTQSPSPTRSGTSRKPFFARFFNIAEKFTSSDSQSRSSSVSGKRLQRRHSSGASSKGRPSVPVPR